MVHVDKLPLGTEASGWMTIVEGLKLKQIDVTCGACGGEGHRTKVDGRELRSLRVAAGVTVARMAAQMKRGRAYISMLERNQRFCSHAQAARYMKALWAVQKTQKGRK